MLRIHQRNAIYRSSPRHPKKNKQIKVPTRYLTLSFCGQPILANVLAEADKVGDSDSSLAVDATGGACVCTAMIHLVVGVVCACFGKVGFVRATLACLHVSPRASVARNPVPAARTRRIVSHLVVFAVAFVPRVC